MLLLCRSNDLWYYYDICYTVCWCFTLDNCGSTVILQNLATETPFIFITEIYSLAHYYITDIKYLVIMSITAVCLLSSRAIMWDTLELERESYCELLLRKLLNYSSWNRPFISTIRAGTVYNVSLHSVWTRMTSERKHSSHSFLNDDLMQ